MRITINASREGRGGAIVRLLVGAAFILMSTQILVASLGTFWLHEVGLMWWAGTLSGEELFIGAFLGVFMLVGLGLLIGGISGIVRGGAAGTEPAAEPVEPWLLRPDWADGRAAWEPENDASFGAAALLSFFFVLLTATALFVTNDILNRGTDHGALVLMWLFPVVTGLLAARSFRGIRQKRRFGKSVFTMDHVPGHPGAPLAGTIVTTLGPDRQPEEGFHVMLSCYHRIVRVSSSSSGTRRERVEHLLWRDEQHLRGVPAAAGVLTVPLRFELPADATPTRLAPTDDRIVWCLEVKARQRGLDYVARFEVPVFEGAGDGLPAGEPELTFGAAAPAGAVPPAVPDNRILEPFTGPTTPGVRADLSPAGELERLSVGPRAGRGIGIAVLLFGFAMLAGAAFAQASAEAPFLLVGILAGFGALLLYVGVRQLTVSTTLSLDASRARFRQGMFGGGPVLEAPLTELAGARVELSGTQVGRRAYYALRVDLTDGTAWTVTGLLRDRREADHLARLVEDRITAIPAPA